MFAPANAIHSDRRRRESLGAVTKHAAGAVQFHDAVRWWRRQGTDLRKWDRDRGAWVIR